MSYRNTVASAKQLEEAKKNKYKYNTNLEMIDYQVDPSFIGKMTDAVGQILDTAMPGNVNLARGKGLDIIKNIEKVIGERFGVKCVMGHNDQGGAFCIIAGSSIELGNNDYFDYHAMAKKLESLKNTRPNEYEKIVNGDDEPSDTTRWDYEKWWRTEANRTFYAVLDKIQKDGLELDLKKAKVVKAPKNLRFYVNVDWYTLGNDYKMTEREIVAVILHEIGHCWTHMEYAYKVFSSVQVLNDVIREEYSKRNKTPTEAIKIFYNKTNLPATKSNSKDITELSIIAYKDIIRGSTVGLYSNHTTTDSEQQADEFSSRFGMGAELTTALDKLGLSSFYDRSMEPIYPVLAFMPLLMMIALNTVMISPLFVLTMGGISAVIFLLIGTMVGVGLYDKDTYITYDDAYRRYRRIKNATIRRLSFVEDKLVKEEVLKQIDIIDRVYLEVKKDTENSFFRKLSNWFHKGNRDWDELMVDEMIEDLVANDLITASARWSTYKKG